MNTSSLFIYKVIIFIVAYNSDHFQVFLEIIPDKQINTLNIDNISKYVYIYIFIYLW